MGLYSCLSAEVHYSAVWDKDLPRLKAIAKAAKVTKFMDLREDFIHLKFPIVVLYKRGWFHAYMDKVGNSASDYDYAIERHHLKDLVSRINDVLAAPERAPALLPFTDYRHDPETGQYTDVPGVHCEWDFESMDYARKRLKRYLKRSKGACHELRYTCSF